MSDARLNHLHIYIRKCKPKKVQLSQRFNFREVLNQFRIPTLHYRNSSMITYFCAQYRPGKDCNSACYEISTLILLSISMYRGWLIRPYMLNLCKPCCDMSPLGSFHCRPVLASSTSYNLQHYFSSLITLLPLANTPSPTNTTATPHLHHHHLRPESEKVLPYAFQDHNNRN